MEKIPQQVDLNNQTEANENLGIEGVSFEQAELIMGDDFIGPDKVKKVFNLENNFNVETPPIPFNQEELERAKELKQFLVLRIDRLNDVTALSILRMNHLFKIQGKKVVFGTDVDTGGSMGPTFRDTMQDYYRNDVPQRGWALVSKEILPNSNGKNYLEQTDAIAEYIQKQVFDGMEMSPKYQEALLEFKEKRKDLLKKIRSTRYCLDHWRELAKELTELKINKLCRGSLADTVYDWVVHRAMTHEDRLYDYGTWTNTIAPNGHIVSADNWSTIMGDDAKAPMHTDEYVGVCLTRK